MLIHLPPLTATSCEEVVLAEIHHTTSTPEILSRKEAITLGRTRYFRGPDRPCKNGHVAERQVSNHACVECQKSRVKSYREREPEKHEFRKQAYSRRNEERLKAERREKYLANRPARIAYTAAYRAQFPERVRETVLRYALANVEKEKARIARYRKENADRLREKQRERYELNGAVVRAASAKWAKANPEKRAEFHRNRRALEKEASGRHTKEDVMRIYALQDGRCACCRKKVGSKYDVDHIRPLSKGGSNEPANLQILCPSCNRRKSDKDPIDFMQSRGLLL